MKISLFPLALLSGCVQVGPKDFPHLAGNTTPVYQNASAHSTDRCQLVELPPIEKIVNISINPGKPTLADAGGEKLLKAYVTIRECHRNSL